MLAWALDKAPPAPITPPDIPLAFAITVELFKASISILFPINSLPFPTILTPTVPLSEAEASEPAPLASPALTPCVFTSVLFSFSALIDTPVSLSSSVLDVKLLSLISIFTLLLFSALAKRIPTATPPIIVESVLTAILELSLALMLIIFPEIVLLDIFIPVPPFDVTSP